MLKIIFSENFRVPLIVLFGIIVYLTLHYLKFDQASLVIVLTIIFLGSYRLFIDTLKDLLAGHFALDYIAIIAILVSLYTGQFLVAAVLALMISSGKTLDDYAAKQAKNSLTNLADRIPNEITLWEKDKQSEKIKVENLKVNQEIFIRKGEVIPVDGILISKTGQTDESSLTGEPYFVEKFMGDQIISGVVNVGNPIILMVTKTGENSTYNKIVNLVLKAQEEKSPLVRLADRYSSVFTIVTLIISGIAFYISNYDLTRVLSVLAIATPCPLIIATPVALLGGINSAAKRRIIAKKLASIEVLSRVNTVIFDKTGTLTIGKPKLVNIEILTKNLTKKEILGIAESLERNSLHPLAKALVEYATSQNAPIYHATHFKEVVGKGISGVVNNKEYALAKLKQDMGMAIELTSANKSLAIFQFEDQLKEDSKTIIEKLKSLGLKLYIFTGDKRQSAEDIAKQLGVDIEIKAECSPEDKLEGIKQLQKENNVVAMVGDGINDAPALALADVGLVFSNEEQTAASEAADLVFLGGNFSQVIESIEISQRTIYIAKQSIFWGIGMSIIGMIFATFGFIPPIYGAGLQEAIDVVVIINALRASK